MKAYIKLMRMHHYIKNLLILLPVIFGGQLFNGEMIKVIVGGFIAYSAISSAIYIINDIRDVEEDRLHSTKCRRPIASGAVSLKGAHILMVMLLVLAFTINYLLVGFSLSGWAYIVLYFLLNLAYSYGLKHVPIIDIGILVSGFVLRMLYGSEISGIEISNWLYLTVLSMSFYLGLGKRRNELLGSKEQTRKVLKYYNKDFLDKNMYMCLAITIVFYALWTVDMSLIKGAESDALMWTVPLVILVCMKYSLNIESGSDGDPVEVVLHDPYLLAMGAVYGLITVGILYLL